MKKTRIKQSITANKTEPLIAFEKYEVLTDMARCRNCPYFKFCENPMKDYNAGCTERKKALVRWMKIAKVKDYAEIVAIEKLLADQYIEYELNQKHKIATGKLFDKDLIFQRRTLFEHLEKLFEMKYGKSITLKKEGYSDIQAKMADAKIIEIEDVIEQDDSKGKDRTRGHKKDSKKV